MHAAAALFVRFSSSPSKCVQRVTHLGEEIVSPFSLHSKKKSQLVSTT
jgi:hypothetical protein